MNSNIATTLAPAICVRCVVVECYYYIWYAGWYCDIDWPKSGDPIVWEAWKSWIRCNQSKKSLHFRQRKQRRPTFALQILTSTFRTFHRLLHHHQQDAAANITPNFLYILAFHWEILFEIFGTKFKEKIKFALFWIKSAVLDLKTRCCRELFLLVCSTKWERTCDIKWFDAQWSLPFNSAHNCQVANDTRDNLVIALEN